MAEVGHFSSVGEELPVAKTLTPLVRLRIATTLFREAPIFPR